MSSIAPHAFPRLPPISTYLHTNVTTFFSRCCFLSGQAAGAGPAFPFTHWRQRNRHRFEYNQEETQLTTLLPSFGRYLPNRPKRLIANRKCLLKPYKLLEVLRDHWMQKTDRPRSSLFAFLFGLSPKSTAENWCSFNATSLSGLIAHVEGHHGGNYLMQPGLRESFKQLFQRRLEKRVPTLEKWSWGLLLRGKRQFKQEPDKLREFRAGMQMISKSVLRDFADPLPLGTRGNKLLFKIERDFDHEQVSFRLYSFSISSVKSMERLLMACLVILIFTNFSEK